MSEAPKAPSIRRGFPSDLSPAEQSAVDARVLGCILEKQRITPETYPVSVSRLRRASNQAHNREPRVSYEEPEISDSLRRLIARGWVQLSIDPGIRVRRYRHLLDEALGLGSAELALMAVLLLRGPQTAGKLKQRTERLYGFENVAAVYEALDRLVERGYATRRPHESGQTEERYEQLLCVAPEEAEESSEVEHAEDQAEKDQPRPAVTAEEPEDASEEQGGRDVPAGDEAAGDTFTPDSVPPARPPWIDSPGGEGSDSRLDWLENEVVKLRAQLTALLDELGR